MSMMDPVVTIECDTCHQQSDPYELTPLAGGSWDERGVRSRSERDGYEWNGDEHTCDECVMERDEER